MKEYTSSGVSGLHFGHWKGGCTNDYITDVHAISSSIPYITGYSPKRWQQGIDIMMEKLKGNNRVTKLRAIILYEADFNHNNKIFGREMMWAAETAKVLAKEQYGSRKHALNKRLVIDLARQKRVPTGICSCDLKSCYDRIGHAFASLAMRRGGAPIEPIISMFRTIQKLVHYVRTAFGYCTSQFNTIAFSTYYIK